MAPTMTANNSTILNLVKDRTRSTELEQQVPLGYQALLNEASLISTIHICFVRCAVLIGPGPTAFSCLEIFKW